MSFKSWAVVAIALGLVVGFAESSVDAGQEVTRKVERKVERSRPAIFQRVQRTVESDVEPLRKVEVTRESTVQQPRCVGGSCSTVNKVTRRVERRGFRLFRRWR